jgi:hypothetical protein
MTLDDFGRTVAAMRHAQRAYFEARRNGGQGADELSRARQHEKRVDKDLREIQDALQKTLKLGD